jgi:hypothetical protein
MLGIMEGVEPTQAQQAIQSALPRNQIIHYCAPSGYGMAGVLSSYKGTSTTLFVRSFLNFLCRHAFVSMLTKMCLTSSPCLRVSRFNVIIWCNDVILNSISIRKLQ